MDDYSHRFIHSINENSDGSSIISFTAEGYKYLHHEAVKNNLTDAEMFVSLANRYTLKT